MGQRVKYAGTTVDALRSVQEIERLIVKYGARSFTKDLEGPRVVGIRFVLDAEAFGVPDLPVKLTAPVETVLDIVWEGYSDAWQRQNDREDYREQAERIAWRHLKDLVEQLLLAFEVGVVDPVIMFFGMIEVTDPDTGASDTMGQLFKRRGMLTPAAGGRLLLTSGGR